MLNKYYFDRLTVGKIPIDDLEDYLNDCSAYVANWCVTRCGD